MRSVLTTAAIAFVLATPVFAFTAENRVKVVPVTDGFEVYDTSGRLFRNEGLNNNSMDLRELPPGIYFLQIRNGKDAIIKQLIIE